MCMHYFDIFSTEEAENVAEDVKDNGAYLHCSQRGPLVPLLLKRCRDKTWINKYK